MISSTVDATVEEALQQWNDREPYRMAYTPSSFWYSQCARSIDYCPILSAIFALYRAADKWWHSDAARWNETVLPAFQPLT